MSPSPTAVAAKSKPVNQVIPVGLNEAALDSPTFRATAAHFSDQVDAIEKWLTGYVSSTSRLVHDINAVEESISTYLSKTIPSAADGIIENDYTFLALKRVGDGSRECLMQLLSSVKKMDNFVVDPIRSFIGGDLRNFKELRRSLEQTQKTYDSMLVRYVSQSKTKEPSSLREDAFNLHDSRKAYIQASMDYCQVAPQLRFTMDKLLIKVCSDIWREMKRARDAATNATRWDQEMERVRGWAKEMELSEGLLKRELQAARKQLGEMTIDNCRPSRELDEYSTSTVPFLGSRGPVTMQPKDSTAVISEKQGWLFLRLATGKPVRHSWVRRWYYCRNGIFGWLVPGLQGVLQGDEIGVLLCNVKPAVGEDRRFCFEVKTKSQTLLLQAETQKELTEWLEVFEVTKKKAFEASMSREGPPRRVVIPEFSAKLLDAQAGIGEETAHGGEKSGNLPVPAPDGNLANRHSFDVSGGGSLSRRSITALGRDLVREEGESSREHAARIIQKLDLHRKAAFGSTEAAQAGSMGGIASLISASHNLLPSYPTQSLSPNLGKQSSSMLPSVDSHPGTLAPLTLARPPTTTALSRTAVLATAERGHNAVASSLPTSVVANYWGSNVWATINVPAQQALPVADAGDPIAIVVSDDSGTPLGSAAQGQIHSESLPHNYPTELQAQLAQFRLLFPNVPIEEKLVLVFRAAWTSSSERDSVNHPLAGDGRIYVTPENMYFYGLQMGLVTAYRISLDIIAEVHSALGRDCDFIFLQLGQDTNDTGYTRITIKVFLERLGLLQTRLNLLIDNLQADPPMETEQLITALVNAEREGDDRISPSAESWEEVSASTPVDDAHGYGEHSRHQLRELSPQLPATRPRAKHSPKLHLPTHAVVYEPENMGEVAADRHFEISAKACFHVLFGDKSFVFPKLYFERRAQQIAQGPWLLADEGQMRREFKFKVDYVNMIGRSKSDQINDYQVIEVFKDHVVYVVTHSKTLWHLPHSQYFKLVTKIIITHLAKSKCKLAIYYRIDWTKSPALSKNLVERQALRDAATDAESLAELATDQVRKLGPRSRTSRAIQVYGQLGQQKQVVLFTPAATDSTKKQAIKPRTLTAMLFETARSLGESAVSSLIMWAVAGIRGLFEVITAQRLLLVVLGLSMLANFALTSNEATIWWKEQKVASFMNSIGIKPNPMMSKAIYIKDLAEATGEGGRMINHYPTKCYSSFEALLNATDMDAPWEDAGAGFQRKPTQLTAKRIRRTRQRLGSYRHDLVVAMRVVNRVEREMLQAEWENWLFHEKTMCEGLEARLLEESKPITDEKGRERMPPERSCWRKEGLKGCKMR
ncbi:putative transcription factor SipA3 [Stachybotrys elegans]|uniref:Transcription factor SipA3 n=1 Tax=Stachybotrys elegans TaxID=80388 RepID=A0A8K0WY71_9HYPO|nr:putative transcription factor SipA3 [Stachybotrys elegans]